MIANYLCAVVDIGTNTVRMVIYAGSPSFPIPIMNLSSHCRLGEFDFIKNQAFLSQKAKDDTIRTLRGFKSVLDKIPELKCFVIGTAAFRIAKNGKEFAAEIRVIGFDLLIISGEEEAKYVAYGVVSQLTDDYDSKQHLILDLGGGSLELVYAKDPKGGVSLPIGLLTMQKEFAINKDNIQKKLPLYLYDKVSHLQKHKIKYLTPGGGSFRSLAILFRNIIDKEMSLNGLLISSEKVVELCNIIKDRSVTQLRHSNEISQKRVNNIHLATEYLLVLIKFFTPKYLLFVTGGVREGVIFDKLLKAKHKIDPIIAAALEFARPHVLLYSQRVILTSLCFSHIKYAGLMEKKDFLSIERLIKTSLVFVHIAASIQPQFRATYANQFLQNVTLPTISYSMRLALRLILSIRYGGKFKKLTKELDKKVSKKYLRATLFLGYFYGLLFKSSVMGWNEEINNVFKCQGKQWLVSVHKDNLWKDKSSFNSYLKKVAKHLDLELKLLLVS